MFSFFACRLPFCLGVGALAPVETIIQEMRYAFWYAKHGKLIRISSRVLGAVIGLGIVFYLLTDDEEYYIEEVASSWKIPRFRITAEWKV